MILDLENDLGIKSCSIQKLNVTFIKKTPFEGPQDVFT